MPVFSIRAHIFSSCQIAYWHVLQSFIFISAGIIIHLFRKSANPQKIFYLFYALSLTERSSLLHNNLSFASPYRSVGIVHRKRRSAPFLPITGCLRFPLVDPINDISLCKRNGRAKNILLLTSYISQSLDLHNKSLHLLNIY